MTDWEQAIAMTLDALSPGEVVTYGEIAAQAGRPGAARSVGRYLSVSDGAHPWWRVVTATGRLVPGHEAEQTRRLRAEGVAVAAGRVVKAGGDRR
ncbi:MAG TPA: MGMT family protein [Acidimicrobiia bacterium]|nr:MGMT family protein [Acidimicrobiia bacterium]